MSPPSFEKHKELIRRIEDQTLEPPYNQMFLELSDSALEDMEIVFGPKMSEAEKILAEALIKQYCPKCVYRKSNLMIK